MRAADQVWRLVSGFPSDKRGSRLMMILDPQAVVDDSGSEPTKPHFILAGFVAPAANWAALADEWQAGLDETPKLEYFKMTEAANSVRAQYDAIAERHGLPPCTPGIPS